MPAVADFLSRVERAIFPRLGLKRQQARIAMDLMQRAYDGASVGRRTQGWKKSAADMNEDTRGALSPLRMVARNLVQNNPYAESALSTIADHAVSWGISPTEEPEIWAQWAETTACDADGRNDFYGLQKLVMRTVVESGECLVIKRIRTKPEERKPLPLQLQVIEPDHLDTLKDEITDTGRIIQGVQFDKIGRRIGYWLFKDHPGSKDGGTSSSRFVPAESVLHIYRVKRPGQVRDVSWFAPVIVRMKDFDDFEDATLMKQKIAACLAVITSDVNGAPVGIGDPDSEIDYLEPGMIKNLAPGQTVTTIDPPQAADYDPYSKNQLRAIATGIGIPYEDLTGDYTGMPFSAARMSRLRHWTRVQQWRWNMLVPQLLNPVWSWMVQSAEIMGINVPAGTDWNAPPLPMVDPDKEGLAIMRNIRAGIETLPGAIRERGYNFERFLDEYAAGVAALDKRKIVLDCDPRRVTQQGLAQSDDRFDPIFKSEKTKPAATPPREEGTPEEEES